MTKSKRLIEVLSTGEQLTAKQIASRFSLKNPRATISALRMQHGYAIYGNPSVDSKGNKVVRYRLGRPSREVVAAGYRALASN